MSQFSEHDPMQYEAAMIRGLASKAPRGRWQRRVLWIGGVALAVLLVVVVVGAIVGR